ncbi:MAG: tetratricopeptide repeat protein [Myxococcales bacterium]|nr:tetratricopeptide repeat protein [Myxococcales bacterium]
MKEVACAVCGAMYRFPAADIPPAGKTVTCAKCKARIVVPGDVAGGPGDVIDLADLPAPRRPAATSVPGRSVESVDLPAPKGPTPSAIIDLPAPKAAPRPREPEPFTLDGVDLVAPVGPSPRGAPAEPPRPTTTALGPHTDLPAPRFPIADLPAPKGPPAIADLPAPKGPPPIADLPAPKRPGDITDLPTPKAKSGNDLFDDLPVPKGPSLGDLPAPKRPATPPAMPTPKSTVAGMPPTVPPARPGASSSVPLPAPKGFFDDLPGPAQTKGASDLPAPKGFFDDLPGPAQTKGASDLPAPKGFFDDLPGPAQTKGASDLPAPKGFFDDLPGPAQTKGASDLPAPKGFFDGLPGPAQTKGPGLPAPKGFFDDLPGPAHAKGPELPAPKGFFDDLPQAGASQPAIGLFDDLPPPSVPRVDRFPAPTAPAHVGSAGPIEGIDLPISLGNSGLIELEPANASARTVAPRSHAPSEPPPALELGDGDPLGLDLPAMPTNAGRAGSVVSFKGGGGGERGGDVRLGGSAPAGDLDLATVPRREGAPVAKQRAATADKISDKPKLSPRATKIVLAAALGLAAVGAGGFVMYRRWDAQKTRAADIDRGLGNARKALVGNEPNHWRRATRAAGDVLALNKQHAEALGIAAQGALAAYLDEGTEVEARTTSGRRFLDTAATSGAHHPAIDKAGALRDTIDGDPAAAIKALTPLAARGDADAQLYLGWAQSAAQDWAAATTAFTAAVAARPVAATYGLAQAQAAAGDLAAAHASYLKVIELDPEHVGALVGEVVTAPVTDLGKREASLLAILQRKDIEQADPRAVVRAWTGAGDEARRGGRLDAARDRYRKALAILPNDRGALASLAATELADGKLAEAADAAAKALALAPDDVDANLTAAEIDLRRDNIAEAATRLAALRGRTPPITAPAQLGRLDMIDGLRLEAEKNPDAALAAYERAAAAVGNSDVGPTIAAATMLGRMATAAATPERAAELRAKAEAKLAQVAAAAEQDPALAITLGVAYLNAGGPAQAERWLRSAIEKRPAEVEAHFQLAEALRRQGKQDEAVATLVKAFELDPTRIDLGVELARGFEAAHRDADAAELYKKLLALKDVTVETQVRAGRFFARTGDITTARGLGDALLAVTPDHPTGQFLKAEGLLVDGRYSEARRLMQEATSRSADAQFLDGLGRVSEAFSGQTGDTAIRDEALRAYDQATRLDPSIVNAWAGAGRIRLARGEFDKALTAYEAALKLDPTNPDLPYGIGMAYVQLEERGRAIEWLSRAVNARPRADAYYQLGTLYYEANRAGPAASALDRATALATKDERDHGTTVPWLTDALWLLGTVQQVLRNDGATIRAWEAYLARAPSNPAQAEEVRRFLVARGR